MKSNFSLLALVMMAMVLGSCGPKVEIYEFDKNLEVSEMWSVEVKNKPVYVLPTHQPHVASLGCEEDGVEIDIEYLAAEVKSVAVRPLGKKYDYTVDGNHIRLKVKPYDNICVPEAQQPRP